MRARHKTPTLVSMWMLDVFCCALGCVTLLWLLNSRQAHDETATAKTAQADLVRARSDLKAVLTVLDSTQLRLNSDIEQLTTQLASVRTEKSDLARKLGIARDEAKAAAALLDATQVSLNSAEAKIDANAKNLALMREKIETAEDALRKKEKEADLLAKKATEAATTSDELARLLRKKDDERLALEKRVAALQKQLDDLDARLVASKKDQTDTAAAAKSASTKAAEELAAARTAAKKTEDELNAARGQIKDLLKKVDDANATLIDLQGDKAKLADKIDKLKTDNDNRFAGIVMSGKSVVFMVDMSGSMEKTDPATAAPHKWPVVCDTVAKVMRTIPGLERYQVVVFAKQARWLFGGGEWQRYDGEKSALGVRDALARVQPEGDTNLHSAFDLAFTLRARGLDTIYLFSDGLPTQGPGLTPAEEIANPPLSETKRAEILSKYIRDRLLTTWNPSRASTGRVKIHAIGFFYESPDVGAFLWALSRENEGSFVGMSRP